MNKNFSIFLSLIFLNTPLLPLHATEIFKEENLNHERKSILLLDLSQSHKIKNSYSMPFTPPLHSRKANKRRSLPSLLYREESVEEFRASTLNRINSNSKKSLVRSDFGDITPILEKKEEPLRRYLATVEYLIKSSNPYSNTANIIVYSYPIFTIEKHLFDFLNDLKKTFPEHIQIFLEKLALAAIPNGIDNFMSAYDEFTELKKGLDIPILSMPFIKKFVLEPVELIPSIDSNEFRINNIDCHFFNVETFLRSLKDRDSRLFRSITLADIKNYLDNQKEPPKTIATLAKHFDRTIQWIALKIISEKEQEKRDKLVRDFLFAGRSLLEDHNFHGAMQIAVSFMKPAVERLISEKEINGTNWCVISDFANPIGNYSNYRKLLLRFQNDANCLPVFSILFSDILHAYEIYNVEISDKMNFQAKVNGLQEISNALATLARCRMLSCSSPILDDLKFVWKFNEIQDEILDVFSNLRKEWKILERQENPKELIEWDCIYLAALLRKTGCEQCIEKMCNLGVYSGKSIIAYIEQFPQKERRRKLEELDMNEKMINTIFSANF